MKFEKYFFLKIFLVLLVPAFVFLTRYPEALVSYGEPEEKVIDVIQKEVLEPTRYGTNVIPKVEVLVDDRAVIYQVPDYDVFRKLPQEGTVKVEVQEKRIGGKIRAGRVLKIVE